MLRVRVCASFLLCLFFFFNDTATTEIYTLSLHDALPICVATDCSIVSASAPGYEVWIWMSGGTRSGNCATGRPTIDTNPPRTMMMEMTMATTGRLMKKLAMRRHHLHARLYPRETLGDDAVARLQAVLDDPVAADALPRLHRLDRDDVVGADDADLLDALQLVDGALRHDERGAADVGHGADARVLPGAQDVAGIREDADGRDRAGLDVDVAAGKGDVAFVREDAAVREDQLELGIAHGRVVLELQVLLLADLVLHANGIDGRNSREDGLRAGV